MSSGADPRRDGMVSARGSAQVQRVCAWAGPVGLLLCLIGLMPLAGFLPPPSPADAPAEIVARFRDHATGIRAGMALAASGFTFIVAWGSCIAARTFRAERRVPVLTFIQVALLAWRCSWGSCSLWRPSWPRSGPGTSIRRSR